MDKFTRNLLMITYLTIALLIWLIVGSSMEYLLNYWHVLEKYTWADKLVKILPIFIGALGAFITYRVTKFREYLNDVVSEIKKVSWPGRKETWAATIVVIIAVIIASIILGFFDWVSSSLLKLILG